MVDGGAVGASLDALVDLVGELEADGSSPSAILERDSSTCVRCHRFDKQLHIGHAISVRDGKLMVVSERELYDDENLLALCEECNVGQASDTLSVPFLVLVLRIRIAHRDNRAS